MSALRAARLAGVGAPRLRLAATAAAPLARSQSTAAATPASLFYNIIAKRNVSYVAYIIAGSIVLEVVYGSITDAFWSSMNKGVSAGGSGGSGGGAEARRLGRGGGGARRRG